MWPLGRCIAHEKIYTIFRTFFYEICYSYTGDLANLWISCVTQTITVDVCFSGLLIYEVGAIVTPFPFLRSSSFDEKIIRKIEKSTI